MYLLNIRQQNKLLKSLIIKTISTALEKLNGKVSKTCLVCIFVFYHWKNEITFGLH